MKEKYIELMERVLSAYSEEHILEYFAKVQREGLSEHGFPRLTANIGILIAHGKRLDLLRHFVDMMDFCCKTIPNVKAANDFSVREIVCCLSEIEKSGAVDNKTISRWKSCLLTINPLTCYDKFATAPDDNVRNWALFTALSEYFRQYFLHCDSEKFIEIQLASQIQWLDENGMYMDKKSKVHHPIVYDLVPRGLFSLLLHFGYRGTYYETISENLRKAALATLKMQSTNGEIAFGGRSNQFLHNEPWMITVFEYEANRYAGEGNTALASRFKCAAAKALSVTEEWLSKTPISHIKNLFPIEVGHGCEKYAYFDKYMITTASNLYAAYLVCDDSIPALPVPDKESTVFKTSEHFHKFFIKSCDYALEFDTNADPNYDAGGLGRIHKDGAPSAICLSLPCPASAAYKSALKDGTALSLCPGIPNGSDWRFATDNTAKYEISDSFTAKDLAAAELLCRFENDKTVKTIYTVSESGVNVKVIGSGKIAYMLPAFTFDGKNKTVLCVKENSLAVSYNGWTCLYRTNGKITDPGKLAANRNGIYRAFYAVGTDKLEINITIDLTK